MERNSPCLWNRYWRQTAAQEETREASLLRLRREEACVRWQRIEAIVKRTLGSLEHLRVGELGSGRGTNAALLAKRGAAATLIDSSEAALAQARRFFVNCGLNAEYLRADAFHAARALKGAYDVAMSFGLAEHFRGAERLEMIRAHFDLVRPGGLVIISVPNRWNPPYRLYKAVAERIGIWQVGEERPFSRGELRDICRRVGVTEIGFFGDSLWESRYFLSPRRFFAKLSGRAPAIPPSLLVRQRGTPLDAWFAYALVLWGRKPQ